MNIRKIIFWILLLVVIDQAIKVVINSFFLESRFEIIPSLFEFKPFFNGKYTYGNSFLYRYLNIDLGLWFHIILFLFLMTVVLPSVWLSFRKNISNNKKLIDFVFIFIMSGLTCGLIGHIIWEKGILDYIYLKPLFIFDLKDLYLNCFAILFIVYYYKNKSQMKKLKMKDLFVNPIKQLKADNNSHYHNHLVGDEKQPQNDVHIEDRTQIENKKNGSKQ